MNLYVQFQNNLQAPLKVIVAIIGLHFVIALDCTKNFSFSFLPNFKYLTLSSVYSFSYKKQTIWFFYKILRKTATCQI